MAAAALEGCQNYCHSQENLLNFDDAVAQGELSYVVLLRFGYLSEKLLTDSQNLYKCGLSFLLEPLDTGTCKYKKNTN